MAVTVTDNRTIINEADATTGWTSSTGLTAANTSPVPIESTNRLGMQVSTSTQNAYVAITSSNMSSDGFLIYFWISHRAEFDTTANGGIQIQIGDSAATVNRVGYHVGGSDAGSFRHETGPVQWESYVLDTGNLSAYSTTTLAGSAVNLVLTAITKVGVVFKTLAKSVGGVDNCFFDISRFLDPSQNNGAAITITGGTSGDPGTFAEITATDKLIGDQQAHGVVRQLGAGLYGVQGPLRFGNPTGTSSSWFEDKNVTIAFEDRSMTVNKYKIVIVDNGTGTTTFRLGTKVGSGSTATGADGCNIIVPTGVGAQFDAATDTDVTDVFIYGTTFSGFTQGISFRSGHEFIGGNINASGTITANGATLVNTDISASTATSALLWNVNTDTSGLLDGMNYTIGASGHGIELGSNTPSSITFNGITFTGYGGTPGSNLTSSSGSTDAAVYNNSGKEITINVTGAGTTPSVRNGAGATTIVVSSVPLAVTVIDTATNPIQTAQVAIYLTSDDSELLNDDTDVNGEVSGSYSGGTPAAIYVRVRKSSAGDTKYIPASTTGSISSTGFSITITLRVDPNA